MQSARRALPRFALTLYQPHAQLVVQGAKRIETRSWATRLRERVAIHAALRVSDEWLSATNTSTFRRAFGVTNNAEWRSTVLALPLGAVVGVATVVDCWRFDRDALVARECGSDERWFGDYAPGRYGFQLADVVAIRPIPMRGRQQFWKLTPVQRRAIALAVDYASRPVTASPQ